MLETDDIIHEAMKSSMENEYIRRGKKVPTLKFNGGNVIKANLTVGQFQSPTIQWGCCKVAKH